MRSIIIITSITTSLSIIVNYHIYLLVNMHFSASTLLLLGNLVQANDMVQRAVGPNDSVKEPSIVKSHANTLADEGEFYFGGVLTSFSVVEGTGCPAGTFTPQPIETGKSPNTYVDFDRFVYNSTTSEGPVTCTLKFDFEYTYPEGDGTPVLLAQVSTGTSNEYEENDQERGTNFNLEHTFSVKAGQSEIDNVSSPTDKLTLPCYCSRKPVRPSLDHCE